MVYSPPRPGKSVHKKKGTEQHTTDQDIKFFTKRLADLKKKLASLPPTDKINRRYYEAEVRRMENKLKPKPLPTKGWKDGR